MATEEQLSGVLSEFARTMVTDFPIQAILDHLVKRIVDVLPITAAGVTLIAPGTDPSRIIKGKRMPGHMGARNFTELGLRVVKVDAERNLLFLGGSVPGPMNGLLTVRKQGGPSRHD